MVSTSKKGKGKGSAFEREFCKELSRWWTNGERDDVFYRTAASGARATVRGKKGKGTAFQHGDVACVDPMGAPLLRYFVIELKRGYSASTIQDVLDGRTALFSKWVKQAQESALRAGVPSWLLVTKRDRRAALVWVPHDAYVSLKIVGMPAWDPRLAVWDEQRIIGTRLDLFFGWLTPGIVEAVASCLDNVKCYG